MVSLLPLLLLLLSLISSAISLDLPSHDIFIEGQKANFSNLFVPTSYNALSSLEDVISILRRDESIDESEVFNRVISSVCVLLTKHELVISLHSCTAAVCDKIKQSADGSIQALTEFITKRGKELNEVDMSRYHEDENLSYNNRAFLC